MSRIAVVTGSNTGIGKATAITLAKQGFDVVLACRSKDKTEPVVAEINQLTGRAAATFHELDLNDLDAVMKSAAALDARVPKIDVLINNAGLGGIRSVKATAQNFEVTMGVNHLGPSLFTLRLEALLKRSAPARVVFVASHSHYMAKTPIELEAFMGARSDFTGTKQYAFSKLANVQFSAALAREWAPLHINTYALHPGVIASDIWRHIPWPVRPVLKVVLRMKSVEEGAVASVKCATDASLANATGLYYDEHGAEKQPSRIARDAQLQNRLFADTKKVLAPWLG